MKRWLFLYKLSFMQIVKLTGPHHIPQTAIEYWKKTIIFQAIISLLYFGIYMTLALVVFNYYGITEQLNSLSPYFGGDLEVLQKKYIELATSENFRLASYWIVGIVSLLWPLNLGLLKIYSRIDAKEMITPRDLFAGYEGIDFFKYLGYGLLWNVIFFFSKTLFFLAPIWVLITLLAGPLLFLGKQSIPNALRLSMQAVSTNLSLSLFLLCLGFLLSYSGLLLCILGVVFTYPFWNALLYVYYKKVFIAEN